MCRCFYLLLVLVLWALPVWALTVNIDTESRCDVAGDDCPVPVAVMFRTDITDANFLIWHCEWDFGDDDAASGGTAEWTESAHPTGSQLALKNKAVGPIAGHVYEGFASSPYTVTVTCDDGSTTGSNTQEVHTDDPDTQWATTNTICIANGTTPVAGSGGCPSGASVLDSSDWDAAVNDNAAADRRILFKKGDSFVQSTRINLRGLGGPSMIGAYGTGAKPIVTFPTQSTGAGNAAVQVDNTSDWRLVDIDFNGTNTGARYWFCSLAACGDGGVADVNTDILFLRDDILSPSAYIYHHPKTGNASIEADINMFIVEGTITGSGVAPNLNAIFGGHDGGGILGLNMDAGTVHNLRVMCQLDSLYQHSSWEGTVSSGDDWRACSFASGFTDSKRTLISDNTFDAGGISIKPNATAGTDGMIAAYGIFERNNQNDHTVQIRMRQNWVLRNNLCARSADQCIQIGRAANNAGDFTNIRVYNNSYRRSTAASVVLWASDMACGDTSCECKNNLLYAVGSTSEACVDSSTGTAVVISGNVNPSTSPFTVDPPVNRNDYALDDSGITDAADKETVLSGILIDAAWGCRPTGAGLGDVGAMEDAVSEGPCLSAVITPGGGIGGGIGDSGMPGIPH